MASINFNIPSALSIQGVLTIAGGINRTPFANTLAQICGATSTATMVTIETEAAAGQYVLRYASSGGTAVANGNSLGAFAWQGMGASVFSTASRAYVQATATETWTNTAQGLMLEFFVTATAGIVTAAAAQIRSTGLTVVGQVATAASSTALSSLSLPHGVAPTSPVNGDLWTTTAGLFARINGSTVGPFGTGATGAANPTASIGLTIVNGVASTFMRSDGAPALDVTISPVWTGVHTFNPTARSSGNVPYLKITTPTDTAQTAATQAIGIQVATATRTWNTTGTIAVQPEISFEGPTYASSGVSHTFTDVFTLMITPPIQGTNAVFTRGHTFGVKDSTSSSSSITGGFIVATTFGTAATSVGIGGGNINAGGTMSTGTASSTTGLINFVGSTSGIFTMSVNNVAGTWTAKWPSTAGTNTYVLTTDGSGNLSWAAPGSGGGGTVTATGGALTANSIVLGAGLTDTKVAAGIITDGTSKLTLGVAGGAVGSVVFNNATSGSITLSPVTGALGSVTLSLPAATDTLIGRATTDTLTNKTLTSPVINGATSSGSTSLDFSSNTGAFLTSTGANTLSGAVTINDATTPSLTTASGKTNTGFIQINGKTNGALKIKPIDNASQTVTLSLAAQTSGAGTATIPDMAATSDTFVFLAMAQTLTNKTLTSPVLTTPVINGATSTGSSSIDFSGNSGTFKTTTGATTLGSTATVAGTITAGTASGTTGALLLNGTTSGTFTMTVNAAAGTWTAKWPSTAGTNGYSLTTDGSGNLAWTSVSAGGGGVLVGDSPTWTGIHTWTPTARASGVASYFTVNTPTDTGITASTEAIGMNFATGIRTWATTGTVTVQREILFAGKTYASASASQTFTDIFTVVVTPPIQGTNAVITRGHSFGVIDSTSASSSITGGLIVAATAGTTATSVGIGGGNINAGGSIIGATLGVNGTPSSRFPVLFQGAVTNSSGTGAAVSIASTITSAANSDFSYGILNQPTFATTSGGLTGLLAATQFIATPTVTGTSGLNTSYQLYIDSAATATNKYGIYQNGTDENLLSGNLGIGGAASGSVVKCAFYMLKSVTASSGAGAQINVMGAATANANSDSLYTFRLSGAFGTTTRTALTSYSLYIETASTSGSGTIDNNYGIYINTPSAGTTNYAIYTVGGKVTFGGTTQLTGNVGIGGTQLSNVGLYVVTSISGNSNYGLLVAPTFTFTGNSQGVIGTQLYATTLATATFTGLIYVGTKFGTPAVTGSGTITTAYQLYIDAAPTATTKYGIYQAGTDANFLSGGLQVPQLGVGAAYTSRVPVAISPAGTASAGSTIGIFTNPTLTAVSNSDQLSGMQNTSVFATTNGGLTGLLAFSYVINTPSVTGSSGLSQSYQLYIAAGATATTRYGIYQGGSDANVLGGSLTMAVNKDITLSGTGKVTVSQAPVSGTDLCNKTYVDSVVGGGSGIIINVKDYGATGNGSTNDTAAIVAAMAVMANYSTLYFPSGKYKLDLNTLTFTTLSYVTIMGDGRSSVLYNTDTTPAGNHYMVLFSAGCDHITLKDFSVVCSATSRVSGAHGIIMGAPYSLISQIFCTGTGDFGIQCSSGSTSLSSDIQVVNCLSDATLGDGFHMSGVQDSGIYNCIANNVGDDGLGIGYDVSVTYSPTRIEVVGFHSHLAGGIGSSGCGIRIFDGAIDVHINGGSATSSKEAALSCGRFSSTTAFNTRITINGFKAYGCLGSMYGQINFQFVNQLLVQGCWSEAPTNNGCYAFLDCNNVTVSGNTAKDAAVRGFCTDDGTTTNVASTCSNWTIIGNTCIGAPSSEAYYFIPPTGKTITNLIITGNTEMGQSASNYINTNRLAGTCKINNNTSLGGKTITNGGSGSVPTTANNN